jgi:aminopeptidase-like protein
MNLEIQNLMENFFDRLWPLNRSITGPGVRASLDVLSELMPMERLCFDSGEEVFDWTVPKEWEARDAYIIGPNGQRFADFKKNNLHLVGYSIPVDQTCCLDELKLHLHTLPDQPNAIPYVTSYYDEDWGFCLAYSEYRALQEGEYRVVIDSELREGRLELGEAVLPGETDDEVLFSTYLCHPSMANNELSGPLTVAFLYRVLSQRPHRRFTYRFVIGQETIGTICFLSCRGKHLLRHLKAGYVLSCIGDPGNFTFISSRRDNSLADRAARLVLRDHGPYECRPFDAGSGSEERQYCSPGFNLPVALMMRTPAGEYPEYHTSLDNKDFISFAALEESVHVCSKIVDALEANVVWRNMQPYCEPQLGRRGLYPRRSADQTPQGLFRSIKWLLNLADGEHDLLAVAERSGKPVQDLIKAAECLSEAGLLVCDEERKKRDA